MISGAIKYAVEKINNCSSLLEDVELDFLYNDTQGDVLKSNAILVDHICNDIAAFIGPEGPNCNVEAMVAASKNRAMISYRCSDPEVSDKDRYGAALCTPLCVSKPKFNLIWNISLAFLFDGFP